MKALKVLAILATAGTMSAYAATTDTHTAPAGASSSEAATMPATEATDLKPITEVAMADAQFTTLVELIQASGLAETLAAAGPYTVFAPTNDAFAMLPAGTVDDWKKPENKEKLASALSYYVVSGTVRAQDIPEGVTEVPSLNGATLKIVKSGESITVNGAKVAAADIQASNGYIHAIDGVVMPDAATN